MGARQKISEIKEIVIHCSATPNGQSVFPEQIDQWHKDRGFKRNMAIAPNHQPQYQHIGYHFVITTFGATVSGRPLLETGAHVRGNNQNTLGICMVGTNRFTRMQWRELPVLVGRLVDLIDNPDMKISGHRDHSPDLNGDGIIEEWEWFKLCPGFTVAEWVEGGMVPLADKIYTYPRGGT